MADQPGVIASNPVLTASIPAAITAVVNWIILMGWVTWTPGQIAGFNLALGSVLAVIGALIVKTKVTPNAVLAALAAPTQEP